MMQPMEHQPLSINEKTKITEAAVKDLVQQRLGFATFMIVHPEAKAGQGFRVIVMTASAHTIATQQAVDAIVQDLNTQYELIKG
jgi:hypothetical protein